MAHAIIVNDTAEINGGSALVAINAAVGLARRGWTVTYVSGYGKPDRRLSEPGIECVAVADFQLLSEKRRLYAARNAIWNHDAAARFAAVLDRRRDAPTVVHVHGWTKSLSASIFPVLAARALPWVMTAHEYFSACPNGGFFDYQRQEICTRRALGASCVTTNCDARSYTHKLWRTARQFVIREGAHFPDCVTDVIYLSQVSRNALASYFSPHTRWHAIANPIEIDKAPPLQPSASRKFVYVGRLGREKGALLLARAARLADVDLLIVGDGEEREAVMRENPRVELAGWLAPEAVAGRVAEARALVLPSLWYEGQPLVVQEAMARGLPAIVSDVTAAREMITDGVDGLICRSGNERLLAEALRKMMDDEFADRAGRTAYEHFWRTPRDLQAHAGALEALYLELMTSHAASARAVKV